MSGSKVNFTVNGVNVLTNVSDEYTYSVIVTPSSITITRKSYTTSSGTWNAPSGYEITSVVRDASNDTYDINFPIGEATDFTNLTWGTDLTVTTAVKSYGDNVKEIKAGNTYHKINADKLNDQEASYYLNYNNFTNTPTIPATNVIPATTTASKLLVSTTTSGTAKWSDFNTAGFLKTNSSGVVSVDTNSYLTTTGTATDSSKLGNVDASNYVQKSNTAGLIKNDGTIDTTTYLDKSKITLSGTTLTINLD